MESGGPEYRTGNMAEIDGEPGAVENRLTLRPGDPRWKDTLESWTDGGEYKVTGGSIRQIAPGEFEVLSIEFGSGDPEPEPESDRGEGQPMKAGEAGPTKPARYKNPAIDAL